MHTTYGDLARLTQLFDDALKAYPHNQAIIEAFRPMVLESRRLSVVPSSEGVEIATLDEERFKAGEPLSSQMDLLAGARWDALSVALIPAISEGLPALKPDLAKLTNYLREHANALAQAMAVPVDKRPAHIEQMSSCAGIDPLTLVFVLQGVERALLAGSARAWADLLEGFAWDKGYCPICGGSPMLARIEEGIPRRWLYCSRCSHAWQFSRVICPACGNDNQRTMTYYFVEDAAKESTFTCESCKHYLITVNKVTELADFDADVAGLSLIHLDVLMQEKGYLPIVETAWNMLT